MVLFILFTALGIVFAVLGIRMLRGNIRDVHEYHRSRVTEENRPAYGKCMGSGMLLCGAGIFLFGIASLAAQLTARPGFLMAGAGLAAAGLAAGIGFFIYAARKYNKGIL